MAENRPGGGARIAVEYVAQQPADGYTMLIAAGAEMTIGPLISKVNYSPIESFTPLTIAIEMPLILLVPADHPAKTVQELVAWAKANPGKSNYATTAPGFTLPRRAVQAEDGHPRRRHHLSQRRRRPGWIDERRGVDGVLHAARHCEPREAMASFARSR